MTTTVVNMTDLAMAFEFISGGAAAYGNRAYVSRDTGRVYCVSDEFEGDSDVPDDIDESDRYVPVPNERSLELGVALVRRFAEEYFPNEVDEVMLLFRRKGAYARFKDYVLRRERLDAWHAYRDAQTLAALADWCASQGWTVDESRPHS
jgi:hypothetical protein